VEKNGRYLYKRDLQKRPTKETYKRDLQKGPTKETLPSWVKSSARIEPFPTPEGLKIWSKETYIYEKTPTKETYKRNLQRDLQKRHYRAGSRAAQ